MKKHKLKIKPVYEFSLICISSHENDYRFVWLLNNKLNFSFIRKDDIEIENKKFQELQKFSLFSYYDEENDIQFNIISNRCENGYFIEELNNFDYFIQIIGELTDIQIKELIKKIKDANTVNIATKIDPNSLISKNKFLF
ncbi:MAG: IPExxxVDY family protein [Bacteroidales bacterium]|nr:IPExxxVDY family protein [Bacteroidales bacterium]